MRGGVEVGQMKKKKSAGWVGIGQMAAKTARWGGDMEDEEENGGEDCEVG